MSARTEGERIARKTLQGHSTWLGEQFVIDLAAAIDKAIADRDEHWATFADAKGDEWGKMSEEFWNEGDHDNARIRMGWASGAGAIATAIRKED